MSVIRIGVLVEGEGEVIAVAKLIHRIGQEIRIDKTVVVKPIVRTPVSRLQKEQVLEDETLDCLKIYATQKIG
jgi:hypothetical protein